MHPRKTADDVETGVTIPADTLVLANTAVANRDPAVYDSPDITRDDPPVMLNFGLGAHYCLGAHLARLELTEARRASHAMSSNFCLNFSSFFTIRLAHDHIHPSGCSPLSQRSPTFRHCDKEDR